MFRRDLLIPQKNIIIIIKLNKIKLQTISHNWFIFKVLPFSFVVLYTSTYEHIFYCKRKRGHFCRQHMYTTDRFL